MKKTSMFFAGAFLVGCIAVGAAACGGSTVDGQHGSCDTDADCPDGNNLACLTSTDGTTKTCEIKCDPTKADASVCPDEQHCETQTDYADPICFELPA